MCHSNILACGNGNRSDTLLLELLRLRGAHDNDRSKWQSARHHTLENFICTAPGCGANGNDNGKRQST
eukprot:5176409-Karenia_brevis.AAC.1